MDHIIPKKQLGQHFLTDNNIAKKIVNSLGDEWENIIEIGPGEGVLTRFLLQKRNTILFLVEIDKHAVELLKHRYPDISGNIINADFLTINPEDYFSSPFAIVGNFPYNISSQLLFKILDNRNLVREVVCMLQKEVAERISSPPGNKQYGILSVLLQAYYKINYLFTVSEKVFYPQPKIKSAVIRLVRNERKHLECNEPLFVKTVKTAFNQRRKTLRNSLSGIVKDKTNLRDDIFNKRPEQLSVEDFIYLTRFMEHLL